MVLSLSGSGQEEEKEGNEKGASFFDTYNRRGITPFLCIQKGEKYPYSLKKAFKKGLTELEQLEEYDQNSVENFTIGCRPSVSEFLGKKREKSLTATLLDTSIKERKEKAREGDSLRACLRKEKAAMRVLDTIFNADEEGRYNMRRVYENVRHGLNDREVKRLEATTKGLEGSMRDMKWAARYLEKVYMIVFDIREWDFDTLYIEEKQRDLDEDPDVDTVVQRFNGYKARAMGKMYRLDLNERVMKEFFQKCWAGPESSDSALAAAKRERKKFEVPLETKTEWSASAEIKETGDEGEKEKIFYRTFEGMIGKWLRNFEKNLSASVFDVASSIFEYKNVGYAYAKIGKKEGLKPDDRYSVYQKVQKGGKVTTEKVGEVRATLGIADNRGKAKGDMERSKFVQTWGKALGKGMLMKQDKEAGLGLSFGWTQHRQNFYQLGLEYRLSSWFGGLPGWYVFSDFGWSFPSFSKSKVKVVKSKEDSGQVETESHKTGLKIFSIDFGTSKEFYLFRDLVLAPYGQLRVEMPEFREFLDSELPTMAALEGGVRLGFNLSEYWRLTGHFAYTTASYDSHAYFGKTLTSRFSEKLPEYEVGDKNPFHLQKRDYRYGATLRLRF